MRCPKCKEEEKTKNEFKNGIQRYKCKSCGCNYTKSTPHVYPTEVKRKVLRYHLEGIGFRRIERLMGISHTAVIYWIKKVGEKIKGFFVGSRDNSAFENLSKSIEHIYAKTYATDV